MNEYKSLLILLKDGGVFGVIGLMFGLISYPESLSVSVVVKYALSAIITGAFIFNIAVNSEGVFFEYRYVISVISAWASYFVVKGITLIFIKFSISPLKTFKEFLDIFKGVKK